MLSEEKDFGERVCVSFCLILSHIVSYCLLASCNSNYAPWSVSCISNFYQLSLGSTDFAKLKTTATKGAFAHVAPLLMDTEDQWVEETLKDGPRLQSVSL